ncbi:MAG: S9 family peptidase, partial [Candidatus Aminicenantes bacterium]|nr:S9 family peptidase [Candidatus Aminicenantes bacterium]
MRRCVYVWLVMGFLLAGTALAAQGQAPAEKTHPFSVHDMLAMDRISDSRVSPDGKWIVFNVRETDLEGNRGRTDIWIIGTGGKGLRRLTSHPAADFNARWSPCA